MKVVVTESYPGELELRDDSLTEELRKSLIIPKLKPHQKKNRYKQKAQEDIHAKATKEVERLYASMVDRIVKVMERVE